eukprot:TRINITY_DN6008_c0_g1_i2.p1 TRINITY_DN6008_c0_g1~~TRINITY_DN6008_c0_g1_i2.p1  ORF type:complete len:724 (-),score=144.00 TRINITY_DN6008_c0_g1_i2:9-2180(-)
MYAAILGILNTSATEVVDDILALLRDRLGECLADHTRFREARLLLRFCVELVRTHVIDVLDAVALLRNLADFAEEHAPSAQSDALVAAVLSAVPWMSVSEFSQHHPRITALLQTCARIASDSPAAWRDALAVLPTHNRSALEQQNDVVSSAWKGGDWEAGVIPRIFGNTTRFATSRTRNFDPPPLIRWSMSAPPRILLPFHSPLLLIAPTRESLRWKPANGAKDDKGESCSPIDQIVVREWVADTLHFFEGNPKEAARQCAEFLPAALSWERLAVEVLFSEMLRLPNSTHTVIYYATVLTALARINTAVPPALAKTVMHLFLNLELVDVEAVARLVEWFALHLTSFAYKWPWDHWERAMHSPSWTPRVRFVAEALAICTRLSFPEYVAHITPPAFQHLLLPPPQPIFAYRDDTSAAGILCRALLEKVRDHQTPSELANWVDAEGASMTDQELEQLPAVVMQVVLEGGHKSFSHMMRELERLSSALKVAIHGGTGRVVSLEHARSRQGLCLESLVSFWGGLPIQVLMTIDKLIAFRVVDPDAVVRWMTASILPRRTFEGVAWKILYTVLDKQATRIDASKAKAAAQRNRIAALLASDGAAARFSSILPEEVAQMERRLEDIEDLISDMVLMLERCIVLLTKDLAELVALADQSARAAVASSEHQEEERERGRILAGHLLNIPRRYANHANAALVTDLAQLLSEPGVATAPRVGAARAAIESLLV